MYKFSNKSKEKLKTCHPDIQKILEVLITMYDFSIIEGHRPLATQQHYYREGKSKLDGINKKSKHQSYPSMAVDIMPYKNGTNAFSGIEKDTRRFYNMMGMVKSIAFLLKKEGLIEHDVRFGLDWDGDDTFNDQNFDDCPHFELV